MWSTDRVHPADLTFDDLDRRPHDVLAALREFAPVAWVPVLGGWVVTGRDEASAVMRDSDTFTVDDPRFSTALVVGPSMLSLDGAEHERHREPFAAAFRPGEVTRRHAAATDDLARRLVADLAPRGTADLRRELAAPLAIAVVARSLGLDGIEPGRLRGWYDRIVAAVEGASLGRPVETPARDAFGELGASVADATRRPDAVLADAADALGPVALTANAAVFLFGGIETGEGMIANLLVHLLSNAAARERLRHDPTLLDNAVEESLRLEPAAARVDRYARTIVEMAGAHVNAGDLVIVSLSAANRDPTVFDRPDVFDITRANARSHLTFAHGPHACIGAQLARFEARAAAAAVLDLLPNVELAGPALIGGIVFRKPHTVPARWSTAGTGTG